MADLHLTWSRFEVSAMQCGLRLLESIILEEDALQLPGYSTRETAKVLLRCASIYLWFLKELLDKRLEFEKRVQAKAYSKLPPNQQPIGLPQPILSSEENIIDDLPLMINEVSLAKGSLLAAFQKK